MRGRPVLQRTRVAGVFMVGGLLIGVLLAASVHAFPGPVVSSDNDQPTSVEVQEDFLTPSMPPIPSRSRCSKPQGHITAQDDTGKLGTMGIGFNCDGAPRSICPYTV